MKKDVVEYVQKCLSCQLIKAEHRHTAGKLQTITLPNWKWEEITMDFVVVLPRTVEGYDAIWVVVDRLTKTARFIPMKSTYSVSTLAELYVNQIVRLHGIPKLIISGRDACFTSNF